MVDPATKALYIVIFYFGWWALITVVGYLFLRRQFRNEKSQGN